MEYMLTFHILNVYCDKIQQHHFMYTFTAKLEARRNKKRAVELARLEKDIVLDEQELHKRELLDGMKESSKARAADGDDAQAVS